jgi:hypothetical protein
MGDPRPTFADDIVDRLRGRLGKLAGDVAFEPCYWAPILQRSQDRVWGKLLAGGRKMDQHRARRWVVSALGDPVGYLSGYTQAGEPVHVKVHECMLRAVARWLNVYDPDDLLGYPIAAAWDELHGTRIDDITVNVGPFPLSETPFTHTYYDRDGGFLDLVVREVRKVADALDVDRPLTA